MPSWSEVLGNGSIGRQKTLGMQPCSQCPQGAVGVVLQPRNGGVHIRHDRIRHKGGMHFGVETHRLDVGGTEQIIGQGRCFRPVDFALD